VPVRCETCAGSGKVEKLHSREPGFWESIFTGDDSKRFWREGTAACMRCNGTGQHERWVDRRFED